MSLIPCAIMVQILRTIPLSNTFFITLIVITSNIWSRTLTFAKDHGYFIPHPRILNILPRHSHISSKFVIFHSGLHIPKVLQNSNIKTSSTLPFALVVLCMVERRLFSKCTLSLHPSQFKDTPPSHYLIALPLLIEHGPWGWAGVSWILPTWVPVWAYIASGPPSSKRLGPNRISRESYYSPLEAERW
jgi:hypothetical protein